MFHANDADGRTGVLTVKNGSLTLHVRLAGKSILNLYPGKASDAPSSKKKWLKSTVESVTYEDGLTEGVFAFDINFPAIDEEIDLALIGKKGVWYDHKVKITDPVRIVNVKLTGGSGKASLETPATVTEKDGNQYITLVFNSKNYDYIIFDGVKYLNENPTGLSEFTVPVKGFDRSISITADTTAMSVPHEVDYTVEFGK